MLRLLPLFLLVFSACNNLEQTQKNATTSGVPPSSSIQYAQHFTIEKKDGYTLLTVKNPWKDAEVAFTYIAYPREGKPPGKVGDAVLIPTPIRSAACMSTTHIGLLAALEATDLVMGLSGTKYIYSPGVQKRVEEGKIIELGYGEGLNYEQLVDKNPDVVFTYGMSEDNNIHKLQEAGLKPVVLAEYVDTSPLGRAEWIKFLAVLLGKEAEADAYFQQISKEYIALKSLAESAKSQPTVFTGMGFQGNWHVPEANSFVAQSIADAGGDYLWKNHDGNGSIQLDFEAVYDKAIQAEVWVNVGMVKSLADIQSADERYAGFSAWKSGRVFNGSKRISEGGGLDIYESAVVNPHLILRDLVQIFHPDLVKEELVYYEKLF